MAWRWSVCGTAEVVWKPRFLWQWPSAHLHCWVWCLSSSSWQYSIDSLWGSGQASLLYKCMFRRLYIPKVIKTVVSASDVTPTDRWLNVWCIRHTKVETLQELRSRHRIGWIIQDFRETCVSRSLTFLPGNKDAVMPNPPHERRKPSCLQMWRCALIRIN